MHKIDGKWCQQVRIAHLGSEFDVQELEGIVENAKKDGYLQIAIHLEESGDDGYDYSSKEYMYLVGYRVLTDAESAHHEATERIREENLARQERLQFERLKAKFEK